MKIDEKGSKILGSDHKRFKLSFTREGNAGTEQDKKQDQTFYTEKQLEIDNFWGYSNGLELHNANQATRFRSRTV